MTKKQPKLTPWFPGKVRPARAGFYERQYYDDEIHPIDRWNGSDWILIAEDGYSLCPAFDQHRPWRGLAVKP